MSKFQFIVLGIFTLFIIVGVISFATYKGGDFEEQLPAITVWGTFPENTFNAYVNSINQSLASPISIAYVQKTQQQFSGDFIAALARGIGPDAVLISADMILPHLDKFSLIPFSALPQRTFQDTYIQESEIYYTNGGVIGIPFAVDPLVMYWNRDTFSAAGLATYPRNWEDFTELNKRLTTRDENGNLRKSAVALGDFTNVNNAREIFGTLLLQIGNPVTATNRDGMVESTLKVSHSANPTPVLQFFTKFVDPSSSDYSWNRGMPQSKSAFLSGMLATYFGFASELRDIRAKNQNLNFDVAPFPQLKSGGKKATYGKMYGFSITSASQKQNSVYQIISVLTNPSNLTELSESMYLPSVNRYVITQGSNDPYISIFNEAVLVARTWLDVDPEQSRQLFGNMVDGITSGRKTIFESIQDTGDQYDILLGQIYQ